MYTYITHILLGPTKINELVFGIASQNQADINAKVDGIFGIGMAIERSGDEQADFYIPVMNALVTQGSINRRVFSVSLGSFSRDRGLLLLGGIDTKRFSGSLGKQRMIEQQSGQYTQSESNACETG